MSEIYFRHNTYRPEQKKLVEEMYEALKNGNHFMAHAPTGLGKTDAALAVAITIAIENNYDVMFLTPKNSQHEIAYNSIKGIIKKYNLPISAVDMIGKRHLCNQIHLSTLSSDDFYSACELRQRRGQCIFFEKSKKENFKEATNFVFSHQEVKQNSIKKKVCGHELGVKLAAQSRIVIGDYSHLFIPLVADTFFKRTKKAVGNTIVIIDEAHNLISRLRDQLSVRLSEKMINKAKEEANSLNSDLIDELPFLFSEWSKQNLNSKSEMEIKVNDFLKLFSKWEIKELIEKLDELGTDWIENNEGRCAMLKLSNFLRYWEDKDDEEKFVRTLTKFKGYYVVEKKCLSPEVVTKRLNNTAGAILVSGTFNPLEMYRDIIGIEKKRTILKEYGNPFPRKNRLFLLNKFVTTKFTKRNVDEFKKIGRNLSSLVKNTPGNLAFFFPSYGVMKNVLPYIEPHTKEMIIQEREITPTEIKQIKSKLNAEDKYILIGVQGGSLSEGVDYENNSLKCIAIIGVPLEEKNIETDARIEYFNKKFKKGWDYGYIGPAMTKCIQSAGRAIRSEKDIGLIVFMDERFTWDIYNKYLPRDMDIIVGNTYDKELEIKKFWNSHYFY